MIRIVILDDHQLFIDGIISSFLNDPEVIVVGYALDGLSGIDTVRKMHPDVILLDIEFSKTNENGVGILQCIKKMSADFKVLVLTGHSDKGLIEALQKEGANGYQIKNIDIHDLRKSIIDVANGNIVYKYQTKIQDTVPPFLTQQVSISNRAKEIIELLAQGFIVKEIAQQLGIAETTVIDHIERVKRKLGAKNSCELVSIYLKMQL